MSDPASRASGSAQARRAGSLTPRVSVQIVRTNAARIASRSAPSCVHRSRSRSRRPSCSRSSSARCRTVGSRTDGRSPVHTEAARPAETGRRPAARRVHDAARRLVRQHPPDRPTSAPAVHQRTVSTSGRHSDHAKRSGWARCFRTPCARGCPSSASPPRTSLMSGCGCRSWRSAGPGTAACLARLNDFAFMAQSGNAQSDRTRVARGADAVPLADANSPVGRRKSDRVDASCVWASIGAVTATASRQLVSELMRRSRSARARRMSSNVLGSLRYMSRIAA